MLPSACNVQHDWAFFDAFEHCNRLQMTHALQCLVVYRQYFVACNSNVFRQSGGVVSIRMHLPATRFPSSAACPFAKTVFTKMPMLPRGEPRPPTILKPSTFFPDPFSYFTFR